MSSRVPGKQTVPRAEAWAMYLVLQEWDGTYDVEIVIDASYTYSGMGLRNRHKHLKGANRDIWQPIYKETDYNTEHGAGHLDIAKIKSHSYAEHLVCRETPIWQMGSTTLPTKPPTSSAIMSAINISSSSFGSLRQSTRGFAYVWQPSNQSSVGAQKK